MSECEPITDKKNTFTLQGGEQKGMKKIVSLALSTAMALSMFASVTSAATLSTQEKYNALVTQGIFEGYPDGNSYLDKDMTRAEFAKVVALLTGLDTAATGTNTYQDQNYANAWYKPYVEAVTKAGYMKGTSTGAKKLFNPNGKVTVQEMAATLVRAAKLEVPTTGINNTAAAWAKGEVQAAINAGLVPATSNFTAAATRGLLVDTAYAFQTAVNKPAVASYEVQDNGATVVFTLANGEKVTVKPEKALVANTATTVNFKYGEFEYSESVTWTVTAATEAVSAAATNLKEVIVTFNGKVDPTSATNINNYSVAGRTIDNVRLSEDGRVATILLEQETDATQVNTLVPNRETSVTVRNILPSTGTGALPTKTLNFTPNDVAVPTVTSVTGLGTQAVQVIFSEPIRQADLVAANFTIDGRSVGGTTINYGYPNSAIIETPLTEGTHTIRISGVRDASGLTIVPTEQTFTVTADTTAPKVVSATSNDLREVTVTFDEPVRSVGGAYANVNSAEFRSTGTPVINGNKVTFTFANNLNYGANSIVINNVRDYSNNSASVTATVTPTLDLIAPTVSNVSFSQTGANFIATIQLSKAVSEESARNLDNYTIRNNNGDVVTGSGRNSAGHPTTTPTISADGKTVTVNLGAGLTDNNYTLTVAGLRDRTVAGNVLLPYTATLNRAEASVGRVQRAWAQGNYVYVEFNKPVATTGTGSALDPAKYTLSGSGSADTTNRLTTRAADIETYGANTVRIYARNFSNISNFVGRQVTVNYVADTNGNYFTTTNGSYSIATTIENANARPTVTTTSVNATSRSNIAVTFTAPLASVRASDFTIYDTTSNTTVATANSATLSADNRTVNLNFNDTIPAPANFTSATRYQLRIADTTGTVDQFGNSATTGTDAAGNINRVTISNEIRPSQLGTATATRVDADTIAVVIPVDQPLNPTTNLAGTNLNVFEASFNNGASATVSGATVVANAEGTANRAIRVVVDTAQQNVNGTLTVVLKGATNNDIKAIVGTNGAAVNAISANVTLSDADNAPAVEVAPTIEETRITSATTVAIEFSGPVSITPAGASQFTAQGTAAGSTPQGAVAVSGSTTDTLLVTFPAGTFTAGEEYTITYTQGTEANRVTNTNGTLTLATGASDTVTAPATFQ